MERINLKELALRKIRINGDVLGKFGSFEIEQTYINNTKNTLEVFYTFPISATATITGFEIKVGDKVLKGIAKEKEEAKQEYVENLIKGNSAYLMEQEEDNTFKISIGKIAKEEEVNVKIKYIDKFEVIDNKINILIPTLVKPRYKSDVTNKLIYTSDANTNIKYNVDFNIKISNSIKVKSVESVTNAIKVEDNDDGSKNVIIENAKLNKDFRLDIELKKEETSSGLVFEGINKDKYAYLSFMPEIEETNDKEKDYIFIADQSGSMMGKRIEGLKEAMKKCLKQLDDGDTFNIIPFNYNISFMNLKSIECNEENIKKAEKYVDSLTATGGTEILKPIEFALYNDNTDREKVILLFTDGEVGNTEEIYSFIKQNIGDSRIFPFGIDSSVNVNFIKQMAKYGHGKAEFISGDEKVEEKVLRTFARIQSPLVDNIKVDFGKNKDVEKLEEEDALFNYEFYNVIAKMKDIKDDITLRGTVDGKEYSWTIKKDEIKETDMNIELVYQSGMIDLLEEYIHACEWSERERKEIYKKKIIEIATKYNINSEYTSFITVNVREDKLTEVPTMQNTILTMEKEDFDSATINVTSHPRMRRSAPFMGRGAMRTSAMRSVGALSTNYNIDTQNDFDIPTFLKRKEITEQGKDIFEEFYSQFKPSDNNEEELILFLLLSLYVMRKMKNVDEKKLENYIEKNKEYIKSSKNKENIIKILLEIANLANQSTCTKIKEYIMEIDKEYEKVIKLNINTLNFRCDELIIENNKNEILNKIIDELKRFY